ncbi:amidohydrolase family protein [Sphingomonas colocasiae]|uniref:Amidohydrolase family protein n=1 Tax=Sphingomonas colocasiae TaxID=1848973 RepID=A0ABS7PWQ9_9SPHN|nr:amidohydrolase family protein [Sphingomonas colocasiae]MBY8825726.1 amidohydrolase family protein [Sphingomonas colocasiae]
MAQMRRIATEEAFLIPEILEAAAPLVDRTSDPDLRMYKMHIDGGPFGRKLLDLDDERIAIMDEHGIAMQVLALASPGVQVFDADTGTALAAIANDRLAEAVARHPDRFAGLAAVAPQDPEGAAREIERAATRLGLRGVIINSHTHGEYLDLPKFRPLLEAAAAHRMPIYLHPRAPSPQMRSVFDVGLELAIWGYQVETSLHAMRLIIGGVFDALPDLHVILGHGGEGLPFWLDRVDTRYGAGVIKRNRLERRPSEYFLDNFTITTSGLNWSPALKFCLEVLGADRMMFAVDYPFEDTGFMVDRMDKAAISDEDRATIYHRTAERIFRLHA